MISKLALVCICILALFVIIYAVSKREDYTRMFDFPVYVPAKVSPRQRGNKSQKIPYTVVRSFATNRVSTLFDDAVNNMYRMNPEYEHVFFNDDECEKFMYTNFPGRIYNAYDSLIPGAYKGDLFRMCYLYKNGGVYLDLNKTLMIPLRKVIDNNYDLVTVIDLGSCCVWQAFLACKPGLPVMLECIMKAVENIENKYYGINSLDITGPMMMGRVFKKYYGECVKYPGIYRKKGELVKLLYHAGDYANDEDNTKIIDLNNKIRERMRITWENQTSIPHYGILYEQRKVYKY